jgi:hypothetical protein
VKGVRIAEFGYPEYGIKDGIRESGFGIRGMRNKSLGVDFFWNADIAVWLLLVLVDVKKPLFDILEDGCIIINHPTVQTNLNRGIRNE